MLLSAFLFLPDRPSDCEEARFTDPADDMILTNMNKDRGRAGDLVKAAFSASDGRLVLAYTYARPPFSTGASRLKLKLHLSLFAPDATVQESVHFVVEAKSGDISVSSTRDLVLESCSLEGAKFSAVFELPPGCRRAGASLESRLLWDEGESSDDFSFSVIRFAASAPPPPTPTKRVSNRVRYRPPAPNGRKDDRKAAEAALAEARELAEENPLDAWRKAEVAYRLSGDFAFKRSVLAFILSLKPDNPPPLSEAERKRVNSLIAAEMIRCLRAVPVRSPQGGILRAQYVNRVCDRYGYEKGRVDVGALKRAYLERLKKKRFPEIEEARGKRGPSGFLALGKTALARGRYELAFRFFYEYLAWLSTGMAEGDREEAEEYLLRAAERACGDVPRAEKKALDEMLEHRAFREITVLPSLHFVFIGPKSALSNTPSRSFRRFDAAHLVESDLFDTPERFLRRRIYVFLRELYGIAGGHAGGDVIYISFKFARNRPFASRVDTDLYFHELGHCLVNYIFPVMGLNEGIADLAALAAHDMLGDADEAERRRKHALDFFEMYFTARRLPFEKIPKYAPSCGFFLYPFADEKEPDACWRVLRNVFCAMRRPDFSPCNPLQWLRHFLKLHEPWTGRRIYDRAVSAGIPLPEKAAEMLQDERDYYRSELAYARFRGRKALQSFARKVAKENPDSYYRHLALLYALEEAAKTEDEGAAAALRAEAGIPSAMTAIGPCPLPSLPEQTDLPNGEGFFLAAEDPSSDPFGPGALPFKIIPPRADGWFRAADSPGKRSALLLAACTTPSAGPWDGFLWVTTPHPFGVWADGTLVYRRFSEVIYREPADAFVVPLSLRAGRHSIIVHLDAPPGTQGFAARIRFTDRDGSPVSAFRILPATSGDYPLFPVPPLVPSETLFEDDFSGPSSVRKWKAQGTDAVVKGGRLVVKRGAAPMDRNDFPKREDVRSHLGLFWMKKALPAEPSEFSFRFAAGPGSEGGQRAVVILDGEGKNEINSGLSFHFQRDGKRLTLTLMRYSDVVCVASREIPLSAELVLTIRRYGNRVSAEAGGVALLPFIGVVPLRAGKVGVAFSPSLALDSVLVRRLQESDSQPNAFLLEFGYHRTIFGSAKFRRYDGRQSLFQLSSLRKAHLRFQATPGG